jgi:short-subunit dehydrogenase
MNTSASPRPLAVVTGASSGIGYQLAAECARHGFDLIIAADRPLNQAERDLKGLGAAVTSIQTDLATQQGVGELCAAIQGRQVDALIANAGHGLGKAFLDQSLEDITHVIDTNITGTLALVHQVGNDMRMRGTGRILIVGSIAGFMPGSFQAVYNGSKAFIDSFAAALRNELKNTNITVTCLMPGPTQTEFFERADMMDTKVGSDEKMPASDVARIGFKAMMDGDAEVVAGAKNKLEAAVSHVMPSSVLAERHRKMAEPGTAKQ